MKKVFLFTSVAWLVSFAYPAAAQESSLLHFMNTTVQASRSNPANLPDTVQMYFGVPLLSNISLGISSPLAWSDVFTPANDSLRVNPSLADDLADDGRLFTEFNYDIFTFGRRFDTAHFFTAGLALRGYGNMGIPTDAVQLLIEGNRPFVSKPCNIDISMMGQTFGELALGYTYRVNSRWQIGGRAKLLVGIYDVRSESIKASLTTDPNDYDMTASSDILIKTAQMGGSGGLFGNLGVGFDAGAYYKTPLPGLDLSVSLVDWGFISWDSKVQYLESKTQDFKFTGFNDIGNIGDLMTNLVDTLREQFDPVKRTGESYTTKLRGRLYVSASYDFAGYNKVGALFRTDILQDEHQSALTIMYNRLVGDWLSVSAGNHFLFGRTYFNPSVAMNFKVSTLQFYLAVENISALYVRDMRTVAAQLGFTIVL